MSAIEVLPRLRVELDGRALDANDAASLTSVTVFQRLSQPTLCELTFQAPRAALASAECFLPGVPMLVAVEDAEALFNGEVTAVWHNYGPAREHEVRIRGYDLLHRLRKRQPVRAHVDLNVADLARELVANLNLSVHVEDTGPVWRKMVQWRQSDLELLTEVSARCGLYFTLRGTELHLITLAGLDEAVSLTLGESLLEARVDANTDPACRSVEVRGWDPWLATVHEATAVEPRTGREIALDPAPELVAASGERVLVDETVQSIQQAAALAQAELDRRFAGEVVLEGVAAGDPRLQPGTAVELTGVAAPFEGRYVLTAVTHTVDRQAGFRSRIDTAPPPSPMRARGAITTLGVVTAIDDPEALGRVRVSLPNYRGIETDWLEVLAPGAGVGKGLVSIPDREDRVLVLLAREDPAQGVVLGGLCGTHGPPDAGLAEGRVRRFTFVTPGGQRLRLDDEKKSLRLENSGGCYMELSPGRARIADGRGSYVELTGEQVRVHANTDLELEAPGKTVIIRGAKVDFQEG